MFHALFVVIGVVFFLISVESSMEVCSSGSASGILLPNDPMYGLNPFVDGNFTFFDGKIKPWTEKYTNIYSPIRDESGSPILIGKVPRMSSSNGLDVLSAARRAWNRGQGLWPQMKLLERISIIEKIVDDLKLRREEIVQVLMWEICKSRKDAEAEFDRTMAFIADVIREFRNIDNNGDWKNISGILARVRRTGLGVMLCLGPFNYPFNETYSTLIPALLLGNIIILKIPTIGGLAHMLTAEVYQRHLPPGAMNFISGQGRETMPSLMQSGDIDVFAFIGGVSASNSLIKSHPYPNRLKVFLQLEGKNLGIVLPSADIDQAVDQVLVGSTSFNGQRCTAIKLVMVHESVADIFVAKFLDKVKLLKTGLPWTSDVDITPLPEPEKPGYLKELIKDAVEKGAQVANQEFGGGEVCGALMTPAVIYPVTKSMRLFHEEQFGPVIPISVFNSVDEIIEYYREVNFGQQVSIFSGNKEDEQEWKEISHLVDILALSVGKININTQCGRSPDVLAFSGRRNSALGTMSILDSIREFSIETVISTKNSPLNKKIIEDLADSSNFLSSI